MSYKLDEERRSTFGVRGSAPIIHTVPQSAHR
jgi:hypothetical protein